LFLYGGEESAKKAISWAEANPRIAVVCSVEHGTIEGSDGWKQRGIVGVD